MKHRHNLRLMAVPLLVGLCTLFVTLPMSSQPEAPTVKTEENERISVEDVRRFSHALNQIKQYYVNSVNDKKLFDNAIRGMLEGLDPHSSYLDEQEYKELRSTTHGEFGGLGIEVTMENDVIKVISPIDDSPASKAGIKAGDYIVLLDDKPIKGLNLREAVKMMRGEIGQPVTLTVLREGEKEPLLFNLKRAVIKIQSVKSALYDDHYGYLRISHFQAPTTRNVVQQIEQLSEKSGGKLKGLVLDLRNNPGGLLDSAIQISDVFINNDKKGDEEMIVYTKGRIPGSDFKALANPGDILKGAPIVVLINGGSASGSEIVAGALKDNQRAVLMGTKSFGKGSVQTVLPLDDKRGIKLTTALYYTPDGHSIQATGIQPDILVKNVQVPKKDKKRVSMNAFSEANLQGHLANGNGNDTNENVSKKAISDKLSKASAGLLYSDYQLYQALNMLKGMVVLKPDQH